jgi:putative oxygen-independent coproporphyrinogen III oxidase
MSELDIETLGLAEDDGAPLADTPAAPLPVALYIHVPFCRSKCAYCDFASAVCDSRWHAPYVDAVLFSAAHWASYDLLEDVPTLYFGGGTPTILGDELVRLVEGLRDIVDLRPDAEITVETNPDTTDAELIGSLVEVGVNRFSLGVQSLDNEVLRVLGRRHAAADALTAAGVLAESGRPFSVDLICGVPGQSEESWRSTVTAALATGPGHMSVYPLSIEEGTPLAEQVEEGALPEPDSDEAAAMMLTAEELLRDAGLYRYEVANYARPGEASRHNSSYWTGVAYLGLGPGAASMLPADVFAQVADAEGWRWKDAEHASLEAGAHAGPDARIRFTATSDTTEFIRRPLAAPTEIERLTAEEAAREHVMLGMRLTDGVSAEQVSSAGLTEVLASLADDGLVELGESSDGTAKWRVTERGWLLGNSVFGRIWQGSE